MRNLQETTGTRQPRLRLLSIAVALVLRNLWVWIHHAVLAEGDRNHRMLHLERLRFRRMLDWIIQEVTRLIHEGSMPYAVRTKLGTTE